MVSKIDSNVTGLRYAEETSIETLPGSPVWYPLEPNSYSDFGSELSMVARNPLNPSRQRRKGVITDLDASGGFNQDLTPNNLTRLLQGFFFASIREKATTAPLNGTAVALTTIAAADDDYTAASGLPTSIVANDLVLASGFGVAANNGLKLANATSTGTAISVTDGLANETSPPAAAKVELVGHQFASGDLSVALNGGNPRITSAAVTMTSLPLAVGEWIYVGGDSSNLRFDNNQGFGRISAIAATYIELDKTQFTPTTEAGTSKTVQIFYGNVIKNESDPTLIVRRSYNLERTLGNDGVGIQSEYLIGAVPNELTINLQQADKVSLDLSFVAVDKETRTGTVGVKSGSRPSLSVEDCFNTTSDISRMNLAVVSTTDADISALFGFATEAQITLKNNVVPNKALGTLGAFDCSAGTFEVGGSVTAYFSNVTAVQAVRDNSDVTIDVALVKNQRGVLFDLPLCQLGGGRLNVEQDKAIELPLETNAAESSFGHTLLFQSFPYLPLLAG